MKNKKIYAVAVGAALAFTSAFAISVFAERGETERKGEENRQTEGKSMIRPLENLLKKIEKFDTKEFSLEGKSDREPPSTLTINPQGNARITNGKVTAVSGDIITVAIWKLNFSVHKMPDTKVAASANQELTFEQIVAGDTVDVLGRLDDAQAAFIHAQVIHDRTQMGRAKEQEKGRLQTLINDLIRRLNELLAKQGKPPLPTPSPSPSGSPSPSPSASPNSSSSPSLSPSPSQSPSPSPSPSPSQSPSPSPSA